MKSIAKKIFKTILVFIISTIILYLGFTLTNFYAWCNENQLFVNSDTLLSELDRNKIQELGDSIGKYAQILEDSLDKSYYEENSDYHSLAEYYNPLGFSIWSHLQLVVKELLNKYFMISILSGVAIAIAYAVITSKKMNNILKVIIGYLGVMLIVPPIYMYSWTYRFWDIPVTYRNTPMYFYIGYTAIFILMYVINYQIGVKMAKELNETIQVNKAK